MQLTDRIGRRLKLRDLHILLAVVQSGNMAKAARALSVSHPVISKAITDLERTVGHPLFDRTPHGVEPTIFGRALLKRGIAVFDELQQGVKELEFLADPTAGELSVGCTDAIAAGLLSATIDRLLKRYPRLVFRTLHSDAHTLPLTHLRERKIELVVTRLQVPISEDEMEVDVLFNERPVIVAGATSKWVRRRLVKLAELIGEQWILTPIDVTPESPVFEAFRTTGSNMPAPSVLSFSHSLRISLLATGKYLTVVPGSALQFAKGGALLKKVPVELLGGIRPVVIIYLKNRTLSPVAKLFVEHVRGITKNLKQSQ
jgi:DNA-binding transcriptional LysR family regulator